MTLFDRFVFGLFGAVCCIGTGFLLTAVLMFAGGGHGAFDFTGIILKAALIAAAIAFVIGFIGKIEWLFKIITVPWRFLDAALRA